MTNFAAQLAAAADAAEGVATQALAATLDEADFVRFMDLTLGEAARRLRALFAEHGDVEAALRALHGELMDFDSTGVTALVVRENSAMVALMVVAA